MAYVMVEEGSLHFRLHLYRVFLGGNRASDQGGEHELAGLQDHLRLRSR